MKTVTYYRVNKADQDNFSREGDIIAVTTLPDTDSVLNLTTGKSYTYGGEQGIVIPDINNFPLYDSEKKNLQDWRTRGFLK